jgi:hypothetical protein
MTELCGSCGKPLDEDNASRCFFCNSRFHMAWSTEAPVENCGQVLFDSMSCGMVFACNACINEHPGIRESFPVPDQPPL